MRFEETVYYTDLFLQFCEAWKLATSSSVAVAKCGEVLVSMGCGQQWPALVVFAFRGGLESYESCGHVHGPTADAYIAGLQALVQLAIACYGLL